MNALSTCTVALFTTLAGLLWLNRLAPTIGLLDHPSARKVHAQSTPLTGGLAIAIGVSSLLFMAPETILEHLWVFIGSLLMVAIGTIDDARNIGVYQRLLIQAIATSIAIFGGDVLIHSIGTYPYVGKTDLGWLSYPVTYFALLAGINAFNLIDGLDGLAGSLALIPLLIICYLSASNGQIQIALITGALSTCLTVFLMFNMRFPWQKQARAFLGDAGSTTLGFLLSCFLIKISQGEKAIITPVTALWFIAIPLIDTLTVIALRKLRGDSAFLASKDHLHHILLNNGFPVSIAWAIIVGSATLFSFGVLLTASYDEWQHLLGFALLIIVHGSLALNSLRPHTIHHKMDKQKPTTSNTH